MFLGFAAAVGCVVGMALPLHTVSFFTMKVVRVARVKFFSVWMNIQESSNVFCTGLEHLEVGACNGLYGSHDMQDVAERFCAGGIRRAMPDVCEGLGRLFIFGIAFAFAVVVNVILLTVAIFMLYQYLGSSPKPRQRKTALILVSIGTVMLLSLLVGYLVMFVPQLDEAHTMFGAIFSAGFLSASQGCGISPGLFLFMFVALLQLVMLMLFPSAKTESEDLYVYNKQQAQLQEDVFGDIDGSGSASGAYSGPDFRSAEAKLMAPLLAGGPDPRWPTDPNYGAASLASAASQPSQWPPQQADSTQYQQPQLQQQYQDPAQYQYQQDQQHQQPQY